jgi:asparagine synthase (glutamine-hydrolysing)
LSGIAGIVHLDGKPAEPGVLVEMVNCLAHRGPDGSGVWVEGPVGLGHRMLWTTPESRHEELPLVDSQGFLVLTSDARIDNREELISSLNLKEIPIQKITDSQLILLAYEKWGQGCPEKLIGDFAFAIWDKSKQLLFCARDQVGAKSFFYYKSNDIFVFASELKAILLVAGVPHRLNELKIGEHLIHFFEDKSLTFYKDIFRLPAANSFTIFAGDIISRVYWSLDPKREIHLKSDEEYSQAFLEVFSEAVHCRLRSAYPVASTLSGGLDSSSIACTSRKLLKDSSNNPLHTFSAIFPSLPDEDLRKIDERMFIEAVLASGGFEAHYVNAGLLSPLTGIERALWLQDEPFLAPNLYMHWALYQAALNEGVRVFLDGIDGDVTVSYGLEYLADLARKGRWNTLVHEANAISNKPNASISSRRIIWEYGLMPLVPQQVFTAWRKIHGDNQSLWFKDTAINSDFAKEIRLEERVRAVSQSDTKIFDGARKKHFQNLNSPLIPLGLELLDKATAEFSLEARYPFFDRRLMEFCLALPPGQKLSNGWTRIIMRRAMEGILPNEIQWRFTKANLIPNFVRNLRGYENDLLSDVIHNPQNLKIIEPFVNLTELNETYLRFNSHPSINETDALLLYGVLVLALWLKKNNITR